MDTWQPTGVGRDVNIRQARCKADLAALRMASPRRLDLTSEKPLPLPAMHSVLVLCSITQRDCWADCAARDDILQELQRKRAEQELAEMEIRKNEPELREGDMLFADMATWNYAASSNDAYQRLRRRIHELEVLLYRGTRIERLGLAKATNSLYLAVPEGMVNPSELPQEWGLLWQTGRGITVVKETVKRKCTPAAHWQLLESIFASGMKKMESV
jgi:hypothetical protein